MEVVEGDGGDFFEAFGGEFVEGIVGGVPRGVIEVDEIDGGDAGDDLEWDVVIEDLAVVGGEGVVEVEGVSGGEDFAFEVWWGIGGEGEGEVAIADHVPEDGEAELG